MSIRPDVVDNSGFLLVSEGSDIVEWTFESIDNDTYYITTGEGESKQYLTISSTGAVLKSAPADLENPSSEYVIRVIPGVDGNAKKWSFTANGRSLNLNITNGTANGFNVTTNNVETKWLNLVVKTELEDSDIVKYSAMKVSVSDKDKVYDRINSETGEREQSQVIIYTRVWNDTDKKYEFYIVNYDGSLITCDDEGENIEWYGSSVNTALWEFTEYHYDDGTPNYYYELQNVAYGYYLAPQLLNGQLLSDDTIGLNLNGRRYNRGYTTIVAWDDHNYEYVGLKVEDGKVVPCSQSEADIFYFAIVDETEPDVGELNEVGTVDHVQYGVTMKMVDFNNTKTSDNRDSKQKDYMGEDGPTTGSTGLLSQNLGEDGYPVGTNLVGAGGVGQSLAKLFVSGGDGLIEVNHLFKASTYSESGYFEYNSTQNYAHLDKQSRNFKVYKQLGAITGSNEHRNTREHGQFMPYDDIQKDEDGNALEAKDTQGEVITNRTDLLGNVLPDTDSRKGEPLYALGNTSSVDYFFGMEMSAAFNQTADGLDDWGHDIIFEFSGDDDFWLYVDGVLVIDLGGVHSAQTGSVNFRTGVVTSTHGNTTLYVIFVANYLVNGHTQAEVDALFTTKYIDGEPVKVFKDYSHHTMKMFYMERGSGASNLHMRFNLATAEPGAFTLSKKVSGGSEDSSDEIEFPFQVYYSTEEGQTPNQLLGEFGSDGDYNVTYSGTSDHVPYSESFTPGGESTAYSNVFFLRHGEYAQVRLPEGAFSYYVKECAVDSAVYERVEANGDELTESEPSSGRRHDYETSVSSLVERSQVNFVNYADPDAMGTLSFTKKLYDINGDPVEIGGDDTPFNFRLYLGDETIADEDLVEANTRSYHVKDPDGPIAAGTPMRRASSLM